MSLKETSTAVTAQNKKNKSPQYIDHQKFHIFQYR